VVATVLWLLGSGEESQKPRMSGLDDKDKDNTLTWKDDHGGDIAEYMEVIQKKPPSDSSSSSSSSGGNRSSSGPRSDSSNRSLGFKDDSSEGVLLDNSSSRTLKSSNNANASASAVGTPGPESGRKSPNGKSSESPQWDFFVAITPPTGEKHQRAKDDAKERGDP
jgi:hypothetical protein